MSLLGGFGGASKKNFLRLLSLAIFYGPLINSAIIRPLAGRFRGLREVQVVHVQTGAQSTRTCYEWESPGRKERWQLKTDQNGTGVWPNASTWMRVESRSRVK